MKIFLACLLAGIAYAICTQVLGVPVEITFGAVVFGAVVGFISG